MRYSTKSKILGWRTDQWLAQVVGKEKNVTCSMKTFFEVMELKYMLIIVVDTQLYAFDKTIHHKECFL